MQEIIKTNCFAEIESYVNDDECLVLVDFDNTLYQTSQALGHADWLLAQHTECVERGMPIKEAWDFCYIMWKEILASSKIELMESCIPEVIRAMQNRGIPVLGLTHRHPQIEAITIRQANSLGIDLSLSAPQEESLYLSTPAPALYSQGILFCSELNSKSMVLAAFASTRTLAPKKVLFIDDYLSNIEDIQGLMQKKGIDFTGIHYTRREITPPIFNKELANIQKRYFFSEILSNQEASLLKNKD